ncbi:interferon-induced, double-stranded RNA-activated protein kinase [Nelusetta ayraudi]|uniref:interferon-induced, double-stranded RNA-activated protein kinase n=1 Tax=Nelusetta ayraudi TaxID=303726 RepID=UPI003F70998D
MDSINHIGALQEYVRKHIGGEVKYEDIASAGPDHIKTFSIGAFLNGTAYPPGEGRNKKEARQKAAKNALDALMQEPRDSATHTAEAPPSPAQSKRITQVKYVCWLNEYGNENRLIVKVVESPFWGPGDALQRCHFLVGDKEYPEGTGRNKKEAKEAAAKLVYLEVHGSEMSEPGEERRRFPSGPSPEESSQSNVSDISGNTNQLSITATGESVVGINYIGLINGYCQDKKIQCDYILDHRDGPAHKPHFVYKLVIDKKECFIGEGGSVKKAQQHAAQQAWSALHGHSDWSSKATSEAEDNVQTKPSNSQSTVVTKTGIHSASASEWVVFADPSNPPNDQIQSPDSKSRVRIAANFQNMRRNSMEHPRNFKVAEASQGKRKTASRFKSEFESIQRLGKGTFGRVFKARQVLDKKYFAIKIVTWKAQAQKEVEVLSGLDHCNIVRYYTCWLEDDLYELESGAGSSSGSYSTESLSGKKYLYIQMELCDTTLQSWIEARNKDEDPKRRVDSLTLAQQIVSGVEYFHSKNLIHRDLKPANIMFRNDKIKIGDFGLATEDSQGTEDPMERTVGKGTKLYMAPEQECETAYDRKVDIFAVGLIYFELLWKLPNKMERNKIFKNIRRRETPSEFERKFPSEDQIIKSMLSEKPEDRPEASVVKQNLEKFYDNLLPKIEDICLRTV